MVPPARHLREVLAAETLNGLRQQDKLGTTGAVFTRRRPETLLANQALADLRADVERVSVDEVGKMVQRRRSVTVSGACSFFGTSESASLSSPSSDAPLATELTLAMESMRCSGGRPNGEPGAPPPRPARSRRIVMPALPPRRRPRPREPDHFFLAKEASISAAATTPAPTRVKRRHFSENFEVCAGVSSGCRVPTLHAADLLPLAVAHLCGGLEGEVVQRVAAQAALRVPVVAEHH